MPTLDFRILMKGSDSPWADELRGKRDKIIHLAGEAVIKMLALEGGMASGKPSVAIRLDLPDGRTVIAETSARLFVMAAAAIVGKWPDADDGAFLAHLEEGKATVQIFSDPTSKQ